MTQQDYDAALAAGTIRTVMDTVPYDPAVHGTGTVFKDGDSATRYTDRGFQKIDADGQRMVLAARPLTFDEWQRSNSESDW